MKRIASVSFFGIALALVLAFGIPGNANALDNGTGRIMLVGIEAGVDLGGVVGAGVGIGDGGVGAGAHVGGLGAGANIGDPDRDRYERERAYEREQAHKRAAAHRRAAAHKRAAAEKRAADRDRENRGANNQESTDR
ncbi:MAG: hypothetical protein ACLQVJ_30470 [Syntrophobacteraceae bacterium]